MTDVVPAERPEDLKDQRRAWPRTDYVARVFMLDVGGGPPRKCVTLNVSGGGLLVRGLQERDIGEELRFDLELSPGSPRITGTCRIVRTTPEGLRGVMFASIDPTDRDRLVAFTEERERVQRARRRGA
jgi:c-di-GMP-binding flagellar brake protein YcgR